MAGLEKKRETGNDEAWQDRSKKRLENKVLALMKSSTGSGGSPTEGVIGDPEGPSALLKTTYLTY